MGNEISVAIVALVAGWLGLVLTKEQKVSEFRQEWVNALRDDLARLVAITQIVLIKSEENKIFCKLSSDELENMLLVMQRIKYRLNPDDHEGLIEVVDEVFDLITSKNIYDQSVVNLQYLIEKANEIGHVILKEEWERVKKGEPWFYWSKWAFVCLILAFIFHTIFL